MTNKQLQQRIDTFMADKMEIFPELRHQPEIVIKETSDRRTFSQYLHDSISTVFSARAS